MGIVVQAGQRFASIADHASWGWESTSRSWYDSSSFRTWFKSNVSNSQKTLCRLKKEFKLLAEVFKTYLPPEYPYDVPGAARNVKVTDFDDRVDILPVADPNIFSQDTKNIYGSNTITISSIKSTNA